MNGDFFLDHVVICVSDLCAATELFRAHGFTVTDGGVHANGASRNALMVFADSSYLEILEFLTPAKEAGALSKLGRRLFARGEGLADLALGAASLNDTLDRGLAAGVAIDGPVVGKRRRPDGAQIEFQVAVPAALDLPFLCVDVTPRSLRVPTDDARHANGAEGIARVSLLVRDVVAAAKRFEALFGISSRALENGEREVAIGGTRISFAPSEATSPAEEGRCSTVDLRATASNFDWTELHPAGGGLVRMLRAD